MAVFEEGSECPLDGRLDAPRTVVQEEDCEGANAACACARAAAAAGTSAEDEVRVGRRGGRVRPDQGPTVRRRGQRGHDGNAPQEAVAAATRFTGNELLRRG